MHEFFQLQFVPIRGFVARNEMVSEFSYLFLCVCSTIFFERRGECAK